MNRIYLTCLCGGIDCVASAYRDEELVGLNIQMSPYLSLWGRLWVAIRYVLGKPSRCHWGDTLLTPETRKSLIAFLSEADAK